MLIGIVFVMILAGLCQPCPGGNIELFFRFAGTLILRDDRYEQYKQQPPKARNLPPVAGAIVRGAGAIDGASCSILAVFGT
jgi:hypothetical protein